MKRNAMPTASIALGTSPRRRLACIVALAVLALLVGGYAQWSFAQGSGTQTFSFAAEACHALFRAVRNDDEQALEAILGKELTSSGDESERTLERQRFTEKYQEMHRLVQEPDGTMTLYIGAENWPFPVPLVSDNGRWHFDSEAGMYEILIRRIGANEATAIRVCHALALARRHRGTRATSNDPISQYAAGLVRGSSAKADNASGATPGEQPFHGYYFRNLAGRAHDTAATTASHRSRSRTAFVAYPAEYRSSGVMTFVVTKDGVVQGKDLGPKTAKVARDIGERPGSGWHTVQ